MLDLDNTLADRAGAVSAWLDEFCARLELDDSAKAWIAAADNDGYADRNAVFSEISQRFGLTESAETLVDDYRRRVVELAAPTDGAIDCLEALRAAGAQLAIVSNGSSGQQHAKIDKLGLRAMVDAVIVSGDLDIKKPDPRIFEAAIRECGREIKREIESEAAAGRSEAIWMVGDSALHDIVGAQELGFRTAWLHRGRTWDGQWSSPDITLDSLAELPGRLFDQPFADR